MKVILEGKEVDVEPATEFTVEKEINRDDFVIDYQYPGDLIFTGEGYKILLDAREADYCQLLDVDIQKEVGAGFLTIIEGEIRLTNVEFNHYECSARTKIKQRDLLARILNSWDKETSASGGVDIYENTISAVTPLSVVFVKPFDDSFYANVSCYDWKSAMQYYANYLTGSALTFKSDWYDNLPATDKPYITSGLAIRTPSNTSAPVTSMQMIYIDHAKAFNLLMGLVYEGNTPVLRVEQEDYWYSDEVFANRNELLEVKDRYNEDLLYSTVKIGSSSFRRGDGTNGESLPNVPLFGFSSEVFTINNSCNLDNQLDLVMDGIVDSNSIEDIIVNATESYDQDTFYIQVNGTAVYAEQGEFLSGRSIYNKMYLKNEVIQRFNFQGDVYRQINQDQGKYKAYNNSPIPILLGPTQKLTFPNDSLPIGFPGANYSPSTSRYTAPFDDLYQFRLQYLFRNIELNVLLNQSATFLRSHIKRFTSLGVLIDTYYGAKVQYYNLGINLPPTDAHFGEDFFYIYLHAGDYIEFHLVAQLTNGVDTDVVRIQGRDFVNGVKSYQESECVLTFNGGGLVKKSTPSTYRVHEFEFEDQLSAKEMQEMIRQPQKGLGFTALGLSKKIGHGSVECNIYSGETKFTLLTNDSN